LRRAEDTVQYPPQAVGIIALVNGQVVCADIFDRAATLRTYWSSLIRSYALEAEGFTATVSSASASQASTASLLVSAVAASKQVFRSRGLGSDVRIASS